MPRRENSGPEPLSRRERQIMDVLYRNGRATAAEVREQLTDAPSYSAVRALLTVLENKGHVRHESEGPRYVYMPVQDPAKASKAALSHVVSTFFEGSAAAAAAALIEANRGAIDEDELERLSALIERAKEEGR
jgi:BlaI family transcriptional regulator, penicillinase repressor